MKILAVDFGKKNIGLALSLGSLARPLATLKVKKLTQAVEEVRRVCEEQEITKIVIGLSRGEMEEKTRQFAKILKQSLENVVIEFYDESLTTKEAQRLLYKLGKKKTTRREREHEFAAAVLLDSYLSNERNDKLNNQ